MHCVAAGEAVRYIEFEGYNLLLTPPKNMDRGTCGALPVYWTNKSFASVWKPDADELKALNEGAHICLTVLGGSHPPVAMHVQKFQEMP